MTELDRFIKEVQQALPSTKIEVDAPLGDGPGSTFLTLDHESHLGWVEWRPGEGFGITAGTEPGYGEGPEETIADPAAAAERVIDLLRGKGRTIPPRRVLLRELRQVAGLTQEAVAGRQGVRQAAVSKVESRRDISIRTLYRYVEALGGEVEIHVRIGDEDFIVDPFEQAS